MVDLMIIATIFVGIVALFGEKIWAWWDRPKISLKFDKKSDRCFRIAMPVPPIDIQSEGSFSGSERWYYRLEVINKGGLAKNVKITVDVLDFDKNRELEYFEPSRLRWISGDKNVDLAKKEVGYLNICSQVISPVGKVVRRLRIELYDLTARGINWDLSLGDYIFEVTVYGDNFNPRTTKFKFSQPSQNTQPGDLVEYHNN